MPLSKALIIGFLGSDPEESESKTGKRLLSFDIKIAKWGREDKMRGPQDDWLTVWCGAPHVIKWVEEVLKLKKGDCVFLQAKIATRYLEVEGTEKKVRVTSFWAEEVHLTKPGKNHDSAFFDDEQPAVEPPI